jgi:hypothetical protein
MIIFLPYYVAALALLYFELRGRCIIPRIGAPAWPAAAWIALVVASYGVELAIVRYAAVTVAAAMPWRHALPVGVAEHGMAHPDAVEAALILVAAIQSYALVGLYRSRAPAVWVAAGSAAIIAFSILAPATISPDVYAYVGDALMGRQAYHPPGTRFVGAFGLIDDLFHPPLLPAPYGPLWLALAGIVTAPFSTLLGKIVALRVFGAICYAALIAALRAYGVPGRVLAVAAVNPAIAQQYVADAHNDLMGIALVVAAAALVGARRRFSGAGVTVAASLVKLPFALLALPIFAGIRSGAARYALVAGTLALAVALSWLGGGNGYVQGLTVHVPAVAAVFFVNAAVAVAAFVLLVLATASRRRYAGAVWIVPMMSSYVATWYMTYGLPYALARRRVLSYLLIALPLATVLVDAKFMRPWTFAVLIGAVILSLRGRTPQ